MNLNVWNVSLTTNHPISNHSLLYRGSLLNLNVWNVSLTTEEMIQMTKKVGSFKCGVGSPNFPWELKKVLGS